MKAIISGILNPRRRAIDIDIHTWVRHNNNDTSLRLGAHHTCKCLRHSSRHLVEHVAALPGNSTLRLPPSTPLFRLCAPPSPSPPSSSSSSFPPCRARRSFSAFSLASFSLALFQLLASWRGGLAHAMGVGSTRMMRSPGTNQPSKARGRDNDANRVKKTNSLRAVAAFRMLLRLGGDRPRAEPGLRETVYSIKTFPRACVVQKERAFYTLFPGANIDVAFTPSAVLVQAGTEAFAHV